MVQRVHVQITDDLSGEDGAEPITFSYGGRDYEIDLAEKNQERFFQALKPYIEAGRATSKKNRGKIVTKKQKVAAVEIVAKSDDPAAVREWARANGYEVNERGRIPRAVLDAYNAS